MNARTLYVVNPNSLEPVTRAIEQALRGFQVPGLAIECLTLHEGPPGVVTQADVDLVVPHLVNRLEPLRGSAAGVIVACFSDPGLHVLRERLGVPVLGIGECALLTACSRGQRIGVIAIASRAIPRHLRYYGAMGLTGRVVRERAVDLDVATSAVPEKALARMVEVGQRLRDEDGADVLVMGCAGMAAMRAALQDAVGLPVVEPCQAAAGMALGALLAA